jgi:hypothetical protein
MRKDNKILYKVTVEDPEVLVKPWVIAPRTLRLTRIPMWDFCRHARTATARGATWRHYDLDLAPTIAACPRRAPTEHSRGVEEVQEQRAAAVC